jgi:ActR/RegA family two-component response regulator
VLPPVLRNWQRAGSSSPYGLDAPKPKNIARLNKHFDATGTVMDMPRAGRPNTVNTAENKERLQQVLTSSPHKSKSTRRLSATLAIPRRTLQRMLKDMELKPYQQIKWR